MFETAVSSSVLILTVLLIRLVCRGRISHRFLYALWLLVLARLLLPFPLRESPISVMNAVPQEPVETASEPVPVQHIDLPQDWTNFEALEPVNEPEAVLPVSGGAEPQPAQPDQKIDHVTALDWLALLRWLGTAAVGAVFLTENLLCARRLGKGRTPFQGEIHGCALPVYVAEGIPSPCLFGLIRPAIYLTPGAARDREAIPHILAHESTHYRHLDHIWPIFRALAVALYWWNPLVWLAAHCSRVDCELACDEGALKILGEEQRFAYGRTLVGLVSVEKRPGALFRAATTMTGSKRELTQRIDMIVKRQKTVLPILACAVLVAVAAVGCTFTGAEREAVLQHGPGNLFGYEETGLEKLSEAQPPTENPSTEPGEKLEQEGPVQPLEEEKPPAPDTQTEETEPVQSKPVAVNSYGTNSKGETYGPRSLASVLGYKPDLIEAIGDYGVRGYIRESDLETDFPTIETVSAYFEKNPDIVYYGKPLYNSEGEQIGRFDLVSLCDLDELHPDRLAAQETADSRQQELEKAIEEYM